MTFFYLSDLVSPLFFLNPATLFLKISFGCHPPEGVTRPSLSLVTPLLAQTVVF